MLSLTSPATLLLYAEATSRIHVKRQIATVQ
jgi:hypothetical protein